MYQHDQEELRRQYETWELRKRMNDLVGFKTAPFQYRPDNSGSDLVEFVRTHARKETA